LHSYLHFHQTLLNRVSIILSNSCFPRFSTSVSYSSYYIICKINHVLVFLRCSISLF
jgi:hypothetical protein